MSYTLTTEQYEQFQKQAQELEQYRKQQADPVAAIPVATLVQPSQFSAEEKINFPSFVTAEGKRICSAKQYIAIVNRWFSVTKRTYSDYHKAERVALANTHESVAGFLDSIIPAEGSTDAATFNFKLFCEQFGTEYSRGDEVTEAEKLISNVKVSSREDNLETALHHYHEKFRKWMAILSGKPKSFFSLIYINKIPDYLASDIRFYLEQLNKLVENVNVNELIIMTVKATPRFELTYLAAKPKAGKFNYRAGQKRDVDTSTNTNTNTLVSSVGTNDKRQKTVDNPTDRTLWTDKIRPYCIEHTLCYRCKNSLIKTADGKLQLHARGTCTHQDLPANVMRTFQ